MLRLIAFPLFLLALIGAALPDDIPLPTKNPHKERSASPQAAGTDPAENKGTGSEKPPRPEPRPDETATEAGGAKPDEEKADAAPDADGDDDETANSKTAAPPKDPAPVPATEQELAQCEAGLRKLGAKFERLDIINDPGVCGIAPAYRLSEAAPGVKITPDTKVSCREALAVARWVHKVVMPATEALGDDVRLKQISQASAYVCRHRNSQPEAKISEHARGNALDVSSFSFRGHDPVAVEPRADTGTIEEAFQRTVRSGACLFFTTVLGPGADSFHKTHLHLDVIERDNGWRICQ